MNQQRDRKNFIEYDDLKVLEQHLADYLILQTDTQKDKTGEKVLLLTNMILKADCGIPFQHEFAAWCCIFEVIKMVPAAITLKM